MSPRWVTRRGARARAVLAASFVAFAWAAPLLGDGLLSTFDEFVPGVVHDQDGWTALGSAGLGCAVYDVEVVVNRRGNSPSERRKSLRVSNAVTSGCFHDATYSTALEEEAGESSAFSASPTAVRHPYVLTSWTFASAAPDVEQPALNVQVSPDRGDGGRMSYVEMRDAPDGLLVNFYDFQAAVGSFVGTTVAFGLSRKHRHEIVLEMLLIDGPSNDVVNVYVDGQLRHTGTSWEDYFRLYQGPAGPEPTAPVYESRVVRRLGFRTGGTAVPGTLGRGFLIDSVRMESGAAPTSPGG